MTEQKPLIDRIKPGKVTRQEYAERPFDFYTLKQSGGEITIEESYNWETDKPRVVKIPGFKDPSQIFEKIAIKVTDGIFTKDLHMSEGEYTKLMAAFPSTLTNLRGVTFKLVRGQGLDTKVEYIRVERQDLHGNPYNNPDQNTPQQTNTPEPKANLGAQLNAAVSYEYKMGRQVRIKDLTDIANMLKPGDAIGLITSARAEGWILGPDTGGCYRGE